MPEVDPDWTGQVLDGRYKVIERLAKGGMSFVYLAFDRRVKRQVAIKTPKPNLLFSDEFRKRFNREIRALQSLTHPNLVDIFDLGEHDGMPYIVLRYLEGGTLRRRLTSNQPSLPLLTTPESVLVWLPAVADVLDYLHNQNYLHRDVKPENILFDRNDHPYLSDFGTIKVLCEMQHETGPDSRLTELGQAIGTLPYMAPEVLLSRQLSRHVDQYALAVTVYEVLAGKLPYQAKNPPELALLQEKGPPERLDYCAGIAPALADVVQKALAFDPGKRFGCCRDFAMAYADALKCRTLLAGTPPLSQTPGVSAQAQLLTIMEPPEPAYSPQMNPPEERLTAIPPATPQRVSVFNPLPENPPVTPSVPPVEAPIRPSWPRVDSPAEDYSARGYFVVGKDAGSVKPSRPPFSPANIAGTAGSRNPVPSIICPVCGRQFEVPHDCSLVSCPFCRAPALVSPHVLRPHLLRRARRTDASLVAFLLVFAVCSAIGLSVVVYLILKAL